MTKNKGFTLVEILIVLAIIGILSTVLVVSINPARQFAKARDTERETDITAVMAALTQYAAEHSGTLPDTDEDPETSNFPTTETCIGTDLGCFNLAGSGDTGDEIVPVYMPSLPADPSDGTDDDTGYTIYVDQYDRVTMTAQAETKDPIVITQ